MFNYSFVDSVNKILHELCNLIKIQLFIILPFYYVVWRSDSDP